MSDGTRNPRHVAGDDNGMRPTIRDVAEQSQAAFLHSRGGATDCQGGVEAMRRSGFVYECDHDAQQRDVLLGTVDVAVTRGT